MENHPYITAVVVTYNRQKLLARTIESLKRQSRSIDLILVVNNGSTDGTKEWLDKQTGIEVITQENSGGSGGFHTGIKAAMERHSDWIWCMDDDVFPTPKCLETLLDAAGKYPDVSLLAPRRWQEGKIVCHDFQRYNLTNPIASMYARKLRKSPPAEPTYIVGTAFEGPFFRSDVPLKIGYPQKELFIFCDDTDYCLRAHLAGFRLLYVPEARMEKELFFSQDSWAEREEKKKWKRYYQVRNSAYLNHHYGRNFGVRYVRGFLNVTGYILTAALTAPFSKGWKYADIPRLWKAYQDGIHERLGKME